MRVLCFKPVLAWSFGLSFLLALIPGAIPQTANGIYVTSVPGIPFMAVSELETTRITPDGTSVSLKTTRAIARDSKGRIYKEARRLEPATESATPPIILIDIFEPQTKTYTFIYPDSRTFWKGTLQRPPSGLADEYFYGWPTRDGLPISRSAREEDLGNQTIDGMPVRGLRETKEVVDETGNRTVETAEYWYSDDLHMNLVTKLNKPGKVTLTVTVTQITRSEPDAAIFEIPSDYKRNETPSQAGVLP
jgi:hypothetical protein